MASGKSASLAEVERFKSVKLLKGIMKVLFICNQNLNRSKTAEDIFQGRFDTKSAGLYNNKPVSSMELSWADVVVVMEDAHRSEIAKRFPEVYMKKRILSLRIPDVYSYGEPELIKMLESKVQELLEPLVELP